MDELSKIKRSIQNMASKNRASLYTAKVTAVHGISLESKLMLRFAFVRMRLTRYQRQRQVQKKRGQ